MRGECQCTMYKITDNLRQENNVNQNEYHHIVRHYTDICKNMIKKIIKNMFFILSDLQAQCHFNLYFQKVVQRTGGKW